MAKGVTPDTNANVLLWRVFGPQAGGRQDSPPASSSWAWKCPEEGDYFVDIWKFLKEQLAVMIRTDRYPGTTHAGKPAS